MKKEPLEFTRGSGNIYRDFNVADADVRQLKAILAAEIIKTLDKGELSVRKAQGLTGIDAGDFSRVRNADFRRISVERLMAMINGLGSRVEVKVKVRRAETTDQQRTAGAVSTLDIRGGREIANAACNH
jgi:predicted XRE-type DNA-binding protein